MYCPGEQSLWPAGLRGDPDQWYPSYHGDSGADPASHCPGAGYGWSHWRGFPDLRLYQPYDPGGGSGKMAHGLSEKGRSPACADHWDPGW